VDLLHKFEKEKEKRTRKTLFEGGGTLLWRWGFCVGVIGVKFWTQWKQASCVINEQSFFKKN
jgi:hypothetical protein